MSSNRANGTNTDKNASAIAQHFQDVRSLYRYTAKKAAANFIYFWIIDIPTHWREGGGGEKTYFIPKRMQLNVSYPWEFFRILFNPTMRFGGKKMIEWLQRYTLYGKVTFRIREVCIFLALSKIFKVKNRLF